MSTKRNVGGVDRTLRTLVGAGLVGAGLASLAVGRGSRAAVLAGLGGMELTTAATRYCPVNQALGLDTCEDSPRRRTLLDLTTPTAVRVSRNTRPSVNARLQPMEVAPSDPAERIRELDREWDVERVLEAEASSMVLLGVGLGASVDRRFFGIPLLVGSMMLLHATQGWYPLLPLFRRLGFRTSEEILQERDTVKAQRGDFRGLDRVSSHDLPTRLLEVARR